MSAPERVFTGVSRVGEPQAIADTLTIERIDAPDAEAPGNQLTVTATISCQAAPFTACEAAARFTMGNETRRVPQSGTRDIPEAGQETFSATFTMPESSVEIGVEALEQGSLGRFHVEDRGSHSVESITQQEKLQRDTIAFVPWAVGGGAIGAGAASLTNRPVVGGGAAGVGAGVATKVVADNIGAVPNIGQIIPEFPTTAVLATAALLGGAGLLLWRIGGLGALGLGGGGSPAAAATGAGGREP